MKALPRDYKAISIGVVELPKTWPSRNWGISDCPGWSVEWSSTHGAAAQKRPFVNQPDNARHAQKSWPSVRCRFGHPRNSAMGEGGYAGSKSDE